MFIIAHHYDNLLKIASMGRYTRFLGKAIEVIGIQPGGTLAILDFAGFDMAKMPAVHRAIFKAVECPYAFDFVARDWKKILSEKEFTPQSETHFLMNYLRLLTAIRHPGEK